MSQVPKKNISSEITDIRRPKSASRGTWFKQPVPIPPIKSLKIGRYIIAFLALVAIFIGSTFAGAYMIRNYLGGRLQDKLSRIHGLLGRDTPSLQDRNEPFLESARGFWSALKNIGTVYKSFSDLSDHLLASTAALDRLQTDWSEILKPNGSDAYLDDLKSVQRELDALSAAGSAVQKDEGMRSIVPVGPASYLSLQFDLNRTRNFLNAFIGWLSSAEDRHVLVLFTNTSELRPGGGFLGSYGDAVFRSGHLVDFSVHDINESDRTFEKNVVPPKQLQGLVRRWRAADSNWFFDFSESAHKTLEFMEASKMYASSSFDGVVAVDPEAVSDVLKLTGPIKLGDGLTIDSDNMLREIQKQVQQGQADGSERPKAVLAELAPALMQKIMALPAESRKALADRVVSWGEKKEMMVYFKSADFEDFFDGLGVSGRPAELGENEGYLAVVSANVGGGKTDTFISQDADMDVIFGEDGRIMNKVSVARLHTATSGEPWWYRETNKSYIMVFAPSGSELMGAEGIKPKAIVPRQGYNGFIADEALRRIELTLQQNSLYPGVDIFKESGKQVFAAWSEVVPGQEKTMQIKYLSRLTGAPQPGMKYALVIDKQSGAKGGFTVRFTAPQGLNFTETHSPVLERRIDDPDARTTIEVTFEKA